MTQIQYDIRIAVDIHGNMFVLEELKSSILKDNSWQKILRGEGQDENRIQPLDDLLIDADLNLIDDDYRSFTDSDGNTLSKGGIYNCSMIWTYSSSFNGDTTEYDSDYEFKNFVNLYPSVVPVV